MIRTAIVPEMATAEMWEAFHNKLCPDHQFGPDYVTANTAMINVRPTLPDELIEEAAKAIYIDFCKNVLTLFNPGAWDEISESSRDQFRNMTRAAARVFNGGKDE